MKTKFPKSPQRSLALLASVTLCAPLAALAAPNNPNQTQDPRILKAIEFKANVPQVATIDLAVYPQNSDPVTATNPLNVIKLDLKYVIKNEGSKLLDSNNFPFFLPGLFNVDFFIRPANEPVTGNPPATTGELIGYEWIDDTFQGGQLRSYTKTIYITDPLAPGEYKVEARVDRDNYIDEFVKQNNWALLGTFVVTAGASQTNVDPANAAPPMVDPVRVFQGTRINVHPTRVLIQQPVPVAAPPVMVYPGGLPTNPGMVRTPVTPAPTAVDTRPTLMGTPHGGLRRLR